MRSGTERIARKRRGEAKKVLSGLIKFRQITKTINVKESGTYEKVIHRDFFSLKIQLEIHF